MQMQTRKFDDNIVFAHESLTLVMRQSVKLEPTLSLSARVPLRLVIGGKNEEEQHAARVRAEETT